MSAPPTVTFSLCVVCLRTDIRDGSVTRSKREGEGENEVRQPFFLARQMRELA